MRPLNLILLLLIIAACIVVGYQLPHEPERVVELVPIEVPAERIVEVEKLVEVVKEVEVVREVLVYPIYPGVNLRQFVNMHELREWLRRDKTDELDYTYGEFDCEDFAMALSIAAAEDGYFLGITGNIDHIRNFTIIKGRLYKVEPLTDNVWYWTMAD